MKVQVIEETFEILPEYEKISIAFLVETRLRFELCENGLGGFKLIEEKVETPFVKDYDANFDERPTRWIERFDVSNWGILSAFVDEKRIGSAAVAWKTPGVATLEEREDTACLWDLRVAPEFRGKGVGRALFDYAVKWAKARGCRQLKIETQNINVPACRFYHAQGCEVGVIDRFAYPEWMNEVQIIWYRSL